MVIIVLSVCRESPFRHLMEAMVATGTDNPNRRGDFVVMNELNAVKAEMRVSVLSMAAGESQSLADRP